jgi:hypothetical protein
MGLFGSLFGSSNESASNATTSSNASNTTSTVDSHNSAINDTNNYSSNTSSNSTANNTSTLTQDRRTVTDHGVSASADNSTVSTMNSGNSSSTTSDTTNYTTNTSTTDQGALAAGMQLGLSGVSLGREVGLAGIASNQVLSLKTVDVGKQFLSVGGDLLAANIAFAQHVSDTAASNTRDEIAQIVSSSRDAMNQVSSIAAKPLNAQDPQHILVIVGLVVVAAVVFSKM